MRLIGLCFLLLTFAGCQLLDFHQYDYETHEQAKIRLKGLRANVHKVRGGLWVEKKFEFGEPPPRATIQVLRSGFAASICVSSDCNCAKDLLASPAGTLKVVTLRSANAVCSAGR